MSAPDPAGAERTERWRQDALSVRTGTGTHPKDFDWLARSIPCQEACPARTDVPAYLDAIANGRFDEAYRINLADNVFPAVLGRVCTRPCEPACRHGWKGLGDPVAICFSKRSAADFQARRDPVQLEPLFGPSGKSVAVVGAGAAGLAAARELALWGHQVTVFEREGEPGGLLVQGIPRFRLPRDVVAREIEQVRRCGVRILCNHPVGTDPALDSLLSDFDAVIVAAGAQRLHNLSLPGSDLGGIRHGLAFLREVNAGTRSKPGDSVVVIGGGFTAVDCARAARRLGASSVRVLYRRSEEEMHITPGEIREMKAEGISFETQAAPESFSGNGGTVQSARFIRTEMRDATGGGRKEPCPVPGREFEIACDAVLLAIGQEPDTAWLAGRDRTEPRLFTAGDFASGSDSLIHAIADGKATARRVDQFLMGSPRLRDVAEVVHARRTGRTRAMDDIPRQEMPALPLASRALEAEVETGFDRATAQREAQRCYLCHFKFEIDNDYCIYCDRCLKAKPLPDCIVKVSRLVHDGQDRIAGFIPSTGPEDYRMLYIDSSKCIRCGACRDVCPMACISLQRAGRRTGRAANA